MRPIDPHHSFPQTVDSVVKRQEGINRLEKGRHHFDGIGSRCTGNLQDQDDNRYGLADVSKGPRQRKNNRYIGER